MSFLLTQNIANQQSQAARRASQSSTPVPIAKAKITNPYNTSQGGPQSNIAASSNNPFRSQSRQAQQTPSYSGSPSILHQNATNAALAYTNAQQSLQNIQQQKLQQQTLQQQTLQQQTLQQQNLQQQSLQQQNLQQQNLQQHNLQQQSLQQQSLQQQNLQQNIQPNLQNIQPNLQNGSQSVNNYAQAQQNQSNGPGDGRQNQQMPPSNNHGGVNNSLNGQQGDGQDQWGLINVFNGGAPNQDPSVNNGDFSSPHPSNEHSHPVSSDLQASNEVAENTGRGKSQSGEPMNPRDFPPDFENPYYPMMTQPPEAMYPSFDDLYAAAQAHAREHGYAFVIQRSKRKKNGLKKVLLGCDRNGVSRERMAPGMRKRKTTSRKTGCEFSVYADEEKGQWALKWRSDGSGHRGVQPGMGAYWRHNHPPSENPLDHPRHRKMDQGTVAAVKALKDAGVSARETIQILQAEKPDTLLTSRDIYNARSGLAHGRINIDPEVMEMTPNFTILSKEEKLRNELRTEIFQVRAELEETKNKLAAANKQLERYESFIDLINARVPVPRENTDVNNGIGPSSFHQQ